MKQFTFIDLFSGIGGFHLGCSMAGGKCVLASDIDEIANKTYLENYGITPKGDIYGISSDEIPNFDLLCAGFPCQTFSQIGQKGAFDDERGLLIFQVIRVLRDKKPKAFILENVKNLQTIQNGKVFNVIVSELKKVGYTVYTEILESKDYGTPQIRKRLFFVGIRNDMEVSFTFPKPIPLKYTFSEVMGGKTERDYSFTIRIGGRRSGINNRFNWDSYLVDGEVRYITPQECLLLHGFPKDFILCGNQNQQYHQVGNSVSVFIVNEIVKQLQTINVL
ncbi:MAG: DNA cytosine methyltransferase [Crenarchaeota archaeon]|nr:DNA cytosine methyltransferase [Thermoproteota archaeon]